MSRKFQMNTEHIAERKVRNEYVLIPVSSDFKQDGTLFDLNPMAALIWEQAKAGTPEAEICSAILEEFDADDPEEVVEDVKTILDELVNFGALVEAC
jgi:hypothetical protein